MHFCKEFMYNQRKSDLLEPYIFLNVNISNKLYDYVQKLEDIQLIDGEYHKYCGEIKNLINNFTNYWTDIINECVKEADTRIHTTDKKKLLAMIDETVIIENEKQEHFFYYFLPVDEEEELLYDEIDQLHQQRIKDLGDIKDRVKQFDKQEAVTEFVNYHLELAIRKKNDLFTLAHTSFAVQLAHHSHQIRASFEEIIKRVNFNLMELKYKYDAHINKLLDDLYNANKDKLVATRQERHRNTDIAEVESAIRKIREQIESHEVDMPIDNVEEELRYWEQRLDDFSQIEKIILKVKKELTNVTECLKLYESLRTVELPGLKKSCWKNMGENFMRQKEYLQKAFEETAKTLVTFFAVRGQNRILYQDNIGKYTVDEYGHQVYVEDYGKTNKHVTCDGTFKEFFEMDKYYFDEHGRYIIDGISGEKVYQRADCGSSYKMLESELFFKTTKDCGHSLRPNPNCRMQPRDANLIELLPMVDQVDIKGTLKSEVVKYLWDSVGYLLPQALYETGEKLPRNPIYYIAHRLMLNKYHNITSTELLSKMKFALSYRSDIFKGRKEKATADNKAWKSKQMKGSKPEESDDTDARVFYSDHLAKLNFFDQIIASYE